MSVQQAIAKIEQKHVLSEAEKVKLSKLHSCQILGIAETAEGGFSESGKYYLEPENKNLGRIRISYFCPKARFVKYMILKKYEDEDLGRGSVKTVKYQHLYDQLIDTALFYQQVSQHCNKLYFKSLFSKFFQLHGFTAHQIKEIYDLKGKVKLSQASLLQFKKFQKSGKSDFLTYCLKKEKGLISEIQKILDLSVNKEEKEFLKKEIQTRERQIIAVLDDLMRDSLLC